MLRCFLLIVLLLFLFTGLPARAAADPLADAVSQLEQGDPMSRRQAIQKLGRLRDPRSVPHLLKALKDENPYVRAAAVDVLGRMRMKEAAPEIERLLASDKNAQVRQMSAIALSYVSPADTKTLIAALKDEAGPVRIAAARTLGNLRSPDAVDALIALSSRDDEESRQIVASSLGRIASPRALDTLVTLSRDREAAVRREAAKALGAYKSAIPALKERLADEDTKVRLYAAASLSRLGDPSGEETTLRLLKDEDSMIRIMSANMLSAHGSAKALAALKAAQSVEKDADAKGALDFAIKALQGKM